MRTRNHKRFVRFQLTPEQGTFALPAFSLLNTIIGDSCPPEVECNPRLKYRSADGSCNNLVDGRWGRRGVALQRILPPKYGDGEFHPCFLIGAKVPSARKSAKVSANKSQSGD